MAICGWSQAPQRTMVTEGFISGMEATIGDLDLNQEDQFVTAWNKYVTDSRQANPAAKQQALLYYEAEVRRIVSPGQYNLLIQDPKMQSLPAFKETASQN